MEIFPKEDIFDKKPIRFNSSIDALDLMRPAWWQLLLITWLTQLYLEAEPRIELGYTALQICWWFITVFSSMT